MKKERELERILKALANHRRLRILRYLKKEKEAVVGDIADKIDLSFKSTSRHLSILFAVDVIEKEQRSLQVFYSLVTPKHDVVQRLLSIL